jgi:hypothetical protein
MAVVHCSSKRSGEPIPTLLIRVLNTCSAVAQIALDNVPPHQVTVFNNSHVHFPSNAP